MIFIKTPVELEKMRKACDLVSRTMGEVARHVAPGVTTMALDNVAREFILAHGGKPACLGYSGFPATLCIELNETVVHGFPSDYRLQEGDIMGVDTVVELDGFHGDMCYTFAIGEVSSEKMKLLTTTKESLWEGIEAAKAGNRIGDIGYAVQTYVEKRGYSVVREMCGHGIGKSMHEDPEVANFGRRGTGPLIKPGMCLAIEPMINMGGKKVVIERDGWTCRTKDRQPSAHYEHTVAIHEHDTEIMTTFAYIEEALGDRAIRTNKDR